MRTRVLLTGATGFIGSHLLSRFNQSGHEVFALPGKLEDFADTRNVVRGFRPDWIIHLGGISSAGKCQEHPALAYSVNLDGTIGLIEALIDEARETKFLFASTAQVYSAQPIDDNIGPTSWTEERDLKPQNLYARTKLAAEITLMEMTQHYHLSSVIFRLFNHTHHTQTPDFFLPNLYRQIREGATTIEVGNLDLWRDVGSIQDLLKVFELSLSKLNITPGNTEIFNVCSGKAKRLGDLAENLAIAMKLNVKFEPKAERMRAGEPFWVEGSSAKLSAALGWSPSALDSSSLINSFLASL